VGPSRPLTYLVGALTPVLEGLLVILVVAGVEMGALLKPSTAIGGRVSPASLGIVVIWVVGLYVINRSRKDPRWSVSMPGSRRGRRNRREKHPAQPHPYAGASTARVALVFGLGCAVTLAAGVLLEQSGNELANRLGVNGVIFGATVLAAATALPEVSTGLQSLKLHDYQLAVSDIFGGNAFLPVLFLLATLLSGQAVLPQARKTDIYLTAVGVVLTAVYVTGLLFRPTQRIARMGVDSLVVLVLYAIAVAGLFAIAGSG